MSRFKTFWNYISNAGVDSSLSFPVQKRVMLSNQFALVIGVIALVFSLLLFFRPGASATPTLAVLVIVSSIYFINKLGYIKISRFLVSIIPVVGLLFLNISIKLNTPESIGMVHYISPRMLIVGMISLPLTLFTIDEKRSLFLAILVPLGIGLFFEEINSFFGVSSEALGIDTSYKSTLFEDIILQTLLLIGVFLFLLNLNKQYEEINKKLLSESEAKNESMHKNEQILKNSLKELEQARVEDEKRNWTTKGIAEIGHILRENETEDIYSEIIKHIVDFVGANQGGIYISDFSKEPVVLHLEGCYAYGRKKYVDKQIEAGEGLLGQCYMEGSISHITEVPEGYIEITSGLGEATPNSLILIPLKLNEKVEGVIELASFEFFDNYQIAFLEKIAESLALFIANKRTNEQTKKLLQESKTASETLRSQEQEMRNSFEELQATKEEMEKKEHHYLKVIEQLESKLAQQAKND